MLDSTQETEIAEKDIRRAFSGGWDFAEAAREPDRIPPAHGMEVAFAGRSNVGKSSLINALTKQGNLARTSHTPGRTQEIIFFRNPAVPSLCLVDLPGFGYAEVGKKIKRDWGRLIRDYLVGRPNLARVYFLIDGRRGIGAVDLPVMDQLDKSAVSYQVLLTKLDKIKPDEEAKALAEVSETLRRRPAAHPEVIATSSVSGRGFAELQRHLLEMVAARGD